jgi:hypothetical protein
MAALQARAVAASDGWCQVASVAQVEEFPLIVVVVSLEASRIAVCSLSEWSGMPLAGGPSDKAGNSFERRWTVLTLADLLLGHGQSLRIEVPGEQGEGAEFRLLVGGVLEWHQAKRQRGGGPWTIANMATEGILAPWWPKIQAGGRCVFVSSTGAQELRELAERASNAVSWDEFAAEFLTGEQGKPFQRLRRAWGDPPDQEAFKALRHVDVRLIDEPQLARWVEDRLRAMVTGVPATAAAVLAQLADDSVHRELTATDAWARLAEHGLAQRNLSQDEVIVRRVGEGVESYLRRLRPLYIDGRELPRVEAEQAFRHLAEGRRVLLAGGAGHGKSVVAAQVIAHARREGWPTLVLAADRLPAVDTVNQLGDALNLPDSPATVLAAVAAGGDALLVIDQLDAVSVVSGRHPERLGVVTDLLSQATSHPRVRVLLACRQFDLDNDRELRAVAGAADSVAVAIGGLDESVVGRVLGNAGLEASFPPIVMRLLAVPLHLAIFVELTHAGAGDLAGVRTLTDLYNRYWDVKRQACRAARGGRDDWLAVVERLAHRMSDRQELSVPEAFLDDLDQQVKAMASNGVLVVDQGRIGFFHETFFDYCYARLFIKNGASLQELLTSTEQDLFRRAQVRQLLVYERATDHQRYLQDLGWLLSAAEVRPHLKALVVALLETVSDPTGEEWAILRPLVDNPESPLQLRCWQALRGNPAWFPVLQAHSAWRLWLDSADAKVADRAVWALTGMAGAYPKETAELVGHLRRDTAWPNRVRGFLWMASIHGRRVPSDLLETAIREGLYDTVQHNDLWSVMHRLATLEPDRAVDLLGLLLTRAMSHAQATAEANPFKVAGPLSVHRDPHTRDAVLAAAQGAFAEFVERLLPLLLEIMQRNARPDGDASDVLRDGVWGFRMVDSHPDLDGDLFDGMEQALRQLAVSDPDRAAAAFTTLQTSPYEAAWFLLARAYLGNPVRFADDAAVWLARAPGALHLGYYDAPHWVSRELIAAISPACGDDQLNQLIEALLHYTPPHERKYKARTYRGTGELCLLNALDPARRPIQVERRLAELRRKLGQDDVPPPSAVEFGVVPPPIPQERAKKMTDRHWLRAIARYPSAGLRHRPDGSLVGDASTQAQILEEVTKEDPGRFARLLLRFSDDTAEAYVEAVLRGLAGARLEPQLLLTVLRHAQQIGGSDTDRWIVRLVESEAAATLPAELISMVAQIAVNDPDPVGDEWRTTQPGTTPLYGGDIDMAGLNSTRGAAALALGVLVFEDQGRLAIARDALARLAADPSLQVRAMVAAALPSLLEADAELAVDLFRSAVAKTPDELLASSYVERFLHYTIRGGHYARVADILSHMINSTSDQVRQAGTRQLTVASFAMPELDSLVDAALDGDAAMRAGVMAVLAANVSNPGRRDRTFKVLRRGFGDPSREVRSSAARTFYTLEKHRLDDYTALLEAFADSDALLDNATVVLHMLDEVRRPLPPVVLDICEKFVQAHGADIGDITTAAAGDATYIVHLALRLHAQHNAPDIRRRCLDLIDQLVAIRAHGIDQDLASIER